MPIISITNHTKRNSKYLWYILTQHKVNIKYGETNVIANLIEMKSIILNCFAT